MTTPETQFEFIILEPEDFAILDEIPDNIDLSCLGSINHEQFEADVIDLTNMERACHGLEPLTRNENLARSALSHTMDMAENHFISHSSSDGSQLADRILRAGYKNWMSIAENVAMGHRYPKEVIRGWMDSPGHRKNILNSSFAEIGVAYIEGEVISSNNHRFRGGYWTQNFGMQISVRQLTPIVIKWWQDSISAIVKPDDYEDEELDIIIFD